VRKEYENGPYGQNEGCKMLRGLIDHWVPSDEAVSHFWKMPFSELRPHLEALCDDININNFTFYTKWYSNGIKSPLPFLKNHPEAMNVVTDNKWGQEVIDFFHRRGMTVGTMLQCATFEEGMLPREAVLGSFPGTCKVTGLKSDVEVINPTWSKYPDIIGQMIEEHLRLFPNLDAIFLEFEGYAFAEGENVLGLQSELGNCSITQAEELFGDTSGFTPPMRERWLWSSPAREILQETLITCLSAAEQVFQRLKYRGIRGLVYHAMNYEAQYSVDCIPNRDWWLLPWYYWGWGKDESNKVVGKQVAFCKRYLRKLVDAGYSLCYIGNATLPTNYPETIAEMANFCKNVNTAGYLGMGNPIPKFGLRWHGATEETVATARRIYREELFPKESKKRSF